MAYCTVGDVSRMLSSAGATAFSDNDQDGLLDNDVVEGAIAHAAEEIDFALHERYSSAALATSDHIARWSTVLACYFLCMTRGNPVPESLQREANRILFDENSNLSEIRRGNRVLPNVTPDRGQAPSFANMTIDRRFRHPQKVNWDSERYNTAKRTPRIS